MSWWTLQQLKFKNPQTRRQAVEKLAALGVDEAVSGLISALEDDAAEVRVAAVQALGRLSNGAAVSPLIGALRDPEAGVREAAVGALMQLSDAACAEALVAALSDVHPAVRRRAAKALDFFGWQPGNDAQRVLRAVALGEFLRAAGFGAPALEPLMAALKDFQCPNRR